MKIRTGFVSNSSSSSFVLFFDHKPTDIMDCARQLFNCDDESVISKCIYTDYHDTVVQGTDVALRVYKRGVQDMDAVAKTAANRDSYGLATNYMRKLYAIPNDRRLTRLADFVRALAYSLEYADTFHGILEYISVNDVDRLRLAIKRMDEEDKCKPGEIKDKQVAIAKRKSLLDAFYKLCGDITIELVQKLNEKNKWYTVVRFGDEDGITDGIIEHGNAFDSIKHMKVSEH